MQWTTCLCVLLNTLSGQTLCKMTLGELGLPFLKHVLVIDLQMCTVTFFSTWTFLTSIYNSLMATD